MTIFFKKQKFGTMASVVTSLLLVSGCRSAGVNSTSGNVVAPNSGNPPTLFRSYAPTPQPYGGDTYTPMESPPAILPVPGYSDPVVPPAPSAKNSRRNLFPSGYGLSKNSQQNDEVRQMGSKSEDRKNLNRNRRGKAPTPTLRDDANEVVEEVVQPRGAVAKNGPARSSQITNDRSVADAKNFGDASPKLSSEPSPIQTVPSANVPARTRHSVINQWPSTSVSTRPKSNSSGFDVPKLSPPASIEDSTSSNNDVPRLLTPDN